eukprot:400700-Amphidinium_carterae.1
MGAGERRANSYALATKLKLSCALKPEGLTWSQGCSFRPPTPPTPSRSDSVLCKSLNDKQTTNFKKMQLR